MTDALAIFVNHTLLHGDDAAVLRPLAGVNASFRDQILPAWADQLVRGSSIGGEPNECFAVCRAKRTAVRLRADLGVLRALHAKLKAPHDDERASLVEYASILYNEGALGDREDVVGDLVESIWGDVKAANRLRSFAFAWNLHRTARQSITTRTSLAAFLRGRRTHRAAQYLWRRISKRREVGMTADQLHRATKFFELRQVNDGVGATKRLAIACTTGYSIATHRCVILL